MKKPIIWVGLFLVIISSAVFLFEFTANGSFIGSDDAFIHLRYIENLRSGRGFAFNPGQLSNGSTSPLWVILAAFATRNASDLPAAVKILSTSFFVTSILVFYVLSLRLMSSNLTAIIATSIYATDPWLLKWAGSAMEASLASLLVLSAVFFLMHSEKRIYLITASLCTGIATLVRPENIFLIVFLLLLQTTIKEPGKQKISRVILGLIIYFAVVLPWLIFSITTFGSPLPNTLAAKTVASEATYWHVGWYFVRVIGLTYWPWLIVLAGAVLLSLRSLIRSRTLPQLNFRNKVVVIIWLWCATIPAFYILSKLQTPSTRYLQITTPLLILVGFYGLARVFLNTPWTMRRANIVLIEIGISVLLYNVFLNGLVVLPSSRDFSAGTLRTYETVGKWLESNTPEDSRVAIAIDVGTIGYYANREIIDLGGLNTPEVIPYLPDNLQYVLVSKPEILVITGENSEFSLKSQTRFSYIAQPLVSFPADIGIRTGLDKFTGGSARQNYYVSVYELSWP